MNRSVLWEVTVPCFTETSVLIRHAVTNRASHVQEIDLHTHREFELYINLTGDVSFLAEDRLYPLTRGDVFLARPGEHHHCVYRSDAPHEYFWILFDCEQNREILAFLFADPTLNFLSPSNEKKTELIRLCFSLLEQDLSKEDRFYAFFQLLSILKTSSRSSLRPQQSLPEDLARILSYIEENLAEPLSVTGIAKNLYISQSSIERRFRDYLDLTPLAYIRNRKLHEAATLLRGGSSVLEAGLAVGYADNSHFIRLFRKRYGVTPHQYKSEKTIY